MSGQRGKFEGMPLNLTSSDLSILSLIASGVNPDTNNLTQKLSGQDAAHVADYLKSQGAVIHSKEVAEFGKGLLKQFRIERNYPSTDESVDATFDSFS
jgi:hypothetical protein